MKAQAKWNVVVWAAVTKDLREFLQRDLREAHTALIGVDAIEVHVFASSRRGAAAQEVLCWPPGGIKGAHSGKKAPQSLAAAVKSVRGWNQASHRLLVLWGHGNDAFPKLGNQRLWSQFAVPEAADVAAVFDPAAGLGLDAPDIVGYDACRMATVETAFGLEPLVGFTSGSDPVGSAPRPRYLIASMVPEPATGWPYFQAIQVLDGRWGKQPAAVANGLVEAYAAAVQRVDWCMAAFDLTKVAELRKQLTTLLSSKQAPDPIEFFAAAQGADIADDTDRVDLSMLMTRLGDNNRYPTRPVTYALDDAITCYHAGGRLTGRGGLAIPIAIPTAAQVGPWTQQPNWRNYMS